MLRRVVEAHAQLRGQAEPRGARIEDGALRANARDITFPDGKQMFIGSSGIGAPDERKE